MKKSNVPLGLNGIYVGRGDPATIIATNNNSNNLNNNNNNNISNSNNISPSRLSYSHKITAQNTNMTVKTVYMSNSNISSQQQQHQQQQQRKSISPQPNTHSPIIENNNNTNNNVVNNKNISPTRSSQQLTPQNNNNNNNNNQNVNSNNYINNSTSSRIPSNNRPSIVSSTQQTRNISPSPIVPVSTNHQHHHQQQQVQLPSKNLSPTPSQQLNHQHSTSKLRASEAKKSKTDDKKLKLKEAVVGKTLRSQKMEMRLKKGNTRPSESTESENYSDSYYDDDNGDDNDDNDNESNAHSYQESISSSSQFVRTKIYTPDTNTYGGNGIISNRTKRILEKQQKIEGITPIKNDKGNQNNLSQKNKEKEIEKDKEKQIEQNKKNEKINDDSNNSPPPLSVIEENEYETSSISTRTPNNISPGIESPTLPNMYYNIPPGSHPYPSPYGNYPPPPIPGYPPMNGYPGYYPPYPLQQFYPYGIPPSYPPMNGYPPMPGYPPVPNPYHSQYPQTSMPMPMPNYQTEKYDGQLQNETIQSSNLSPSTVTSSSSSSSSSTTTNLITSDSHPLTINVESESENQESLDNTTDVAKQILLFQNLLQSNNSIDPNDPNLITTLLQQMIQSTSNIANNNNIANTTHEKNLLEYNQRDEENKKLQEQVNLLQEQIAQIQATQQQLLSPPHISSTYDDNYEIIKILVNELIIDIIDINEKDMLEKELKEKKQRELETIEVNKKLLEQIQKLTEEVTIIKTMPLNTNPPTPTINNTQSSSSVPSSPSTINEPPFTPKTESDYQQYSMEHKKRTGKELPRVLYRLVPNRSKFKGANELFDREVDMMVEIAKTLKRENSQSFFEKSTAEERGSYDHPVSFDFYEFARNGGFASHNSTDQSVDSSDFINHESPKRQNRGSKFSVENPLLQAQDDINIHPSQSSSNSSTNTNISSSSTSTSNNIIFPRKTKRLSKDDLEIDTKSLLMASACRPVKWNGRNKRVGDKN